MKIRLLHDIPVEQKHQLTKGTEHEVVKDGMSDKIAGLWVVGHNGENIKVMRDEYEIIQR